MREGNKLSAASVRTANKPGLKADGHNLYLQVSKFGTKEPLAEFIDRGEFPAPLLSGVAPELRSAPA